jgi:hypothetical protein
VKHRALAGLCALLVAGCASGSAGEASGPYVVTAIDYHFHDAHPTNPLDGSRTLVIHNDSVHLHNVTIAGLDYDRDIRAGRRLVIRPVRSLFPQPGRYRFFCKYHLDRGMKGVIVVTG